MKSTQVTTGMIGAGLRRNWGTAAGLLSVLFANVASARAGISSYALARQLAYYQTSPAQPAAPEYWNALAVLTYEVPDEVISAGVQFDAPPVTVYSMPPATPYLRQYMSPLYMSETEFQTHFPETTYTFYAQAPALQFAPLVLPANMYSLEVPYLTGDTFTRLQDCDSATAFGATLNGFTLPPGANDGFCSISIVQEGGGSPFSILLAPSETSFEIPAHTLLPGTSYSMSIAYVTINRTLNAGFGTATSEAQYFRSTTAYFTTLVEPVCPAIVMQPVEQSVAAGSAAAFDVTASGTGPLSYQWRRGSTPLVDGGNISGATSALLAIYPVGFTDMAADYNVVLSNSCGSVVSEDVMMTVNCPTSKSIQIWGNGPPELMSAPQPNENFAAVALGYFVGVGLQANGSIVAWGYNDFGQCDVPAPNTGFIAISTTASHTLGLKADGSIRAWGYNESGACDVPLPNAGFSRIAAGIEHSLAIRADSSIAAWGLNTSGQCNVPLPNAGFIAIAGSLDFSLAVRSDGSIIGWGNNFYGVLNVPSPNAEFVSVSAGFRHAAGLKADGSVVVWGNNGSGQLDVPAPNSGFVSISAGWASTIGLKADGSVVVWGDCLLGGACDVPAPNNGFIAIAGGPGVSMAIRSQSTPISLTSPDDQNAPIGGAASFSVEASGPAPLSYQWRRGAMPLVDGGNISGASTAMLTINPVGPSDVGSDYNVEVSNPCDSVTSNNATLSVASVGLGDMNCDGAVNTQDLTLFIKALLQDPTFNGCDINRADMNENGLIDGRDMSQFVGALLQP